mgnify:CR=1 FL=1
MRSDDSRRAHKATHRHRLLSGQGLQKGCGAAELRSCQGPPARSESRARGASCAATRVTALEALPSRTESSYASSAPQRRAPRWLCHSLRAASAAGLPLARPQLCPGSALATCWPLGAVQATSERSAAAQRPAAPCPCRPSRLVRADGAPRSIKVQSTYIYKKKKTFFLIHYGLRFDYLCTGNFNYHM